MRPVIPAIALLIISLGAVRAEAQSCSTFVSIKSYDDAAKTAEVKYEKGSERKFFPKPEGAPTDTSKIPKKCSKRMTRNTTLHVKPTGGRMSVTQVRSNFEGKMLNDLDDSAWLPTELKKLIEAKTEVLAVVRPGKKKKDPVELTTMYLPITDAETAEIARIDAQAEDVGEGEGADEGAGADDE